MIHSIGYGSAGLTVHPPPLPNDRGWVDNCRIWVYCPTKTISSKKGDFVGHIKVKAYKTCFCVFLL